MILDMVGAAQLGIPRWMILSHLREDVEQIVALVNLQYHTPHQRNQALQYHLRCLRRDQWDRAPRRPIRKPKAIRPSKLTSGYRADSEVHRSTRLRLEPQRRAEIARKGADARWTHVDLFSGN